MPSIFKIPTKQENIQMQIIDDVLYFNNKTHVLTLDLNNQITSHCNLLEDIKFFKRKEFFTVACTDKRIYILKDNEIITTFNKAVSACDVHNNLLFLGEKHTNLFEVWEISSEYKFQMFKKLFSYNKFNGAILKINKTGENTFLLAAEDNTVREYDHLNHTVKRIWKSKTQIYDVNVINGKNTIISKQGIVYDGQIEKHDFITNASIHKNNCVLFTKDKEMLFYKENKMILKITHEVNKIIQTVLLNNFTVYFTTEEFLYVFDTQANVLLQRIPLKNVINYATIKRKQFGYKTAKEFTFCVLECKVNEFNAISIYEGNKLINLIEDTNFKGKNIFVENNALILVGSNGYVGMCNYEDKILFNHYYLNCKVMDAKYDEKVLCISCDSTEIKIVIENKVARSLKFDKIFQFELYKNKIFTQVEERKISIYDIIQEKEVFFELENNIESFTVKDNKIVIRDKSGLRIFNYLMHTEVFLDIYRKDITHFDMNMVNIIYVTEGGELFVNGKKRRTYGKNNLIKKISHENNKIFVLGETGLEILREEESKVEDKKEEDKNMDNLYLIKALLKNK